MYCSSVSLVQNSGELAVKRAGATHRLFAGPLDPKRGSVRVRDLIPILTRVLVRVLILILILVRINTDPHTITMVHYTTL